MTDLILQLKKQINRDKERAIHRFYEHTPIRSMTRQLVLSIDDILIRLFQHHDLEQDGPLCLLALGGYGRRELQLHSDIDLLLLHTMTFTPAQREKVEQFIQQCWDLGLEISHQLTTVSLCAELANNDLSTISTLLDMRLLCGSQALMEELLYQTHPLHMWDSRLYFMAKQQEQHQRYEKYGETAYNLEPNVKNGPGGLRDLHLLLSIGKRHFHIKKLSDGISHGFITDKEYEELKHCQHFLWRVRFALHLLAKKREDRLSFDYQVKLAPLFGYQDNPEALAIEQFMKDYFKIIKRTRELTDMLLQWFAEAIVHQEKQLLIPLDDAFQLSNQCIEVRNPRIFSQKPDALLSLFLWMTKNPEIQGVRANTIRLIHQHLYLINQRFRQSPEMNQRFLALFKTPNNPYEALRHMSRYGVLGHYLECFQAVIGQMQYDLFHVYTVDQHALFVIRNIARFLSPAKPNAFSLCSKLMESIPKREILYLAALFHDIAKGRGGDHAELGALEVEQFALRHELNLPDTTLLTWLVRHHLLMSHTAQRQDIYDPNTIEKFCNKLPHSDYLDYLYLLTVADICATNPALWNAWKDSLLKELYFAAKLAMHQEKTLMNEASLIRERQEHSRYLLNQQGIAPDQIDTLWSQLSGRYFLHESPEVIARHTAAILTCSHFPLILIFPHHSEGGTEVFIYMPHRDDRVAITAAILSNHHMTIQEANILTCNNQYDLDTYIILDEHNQTITDINKITPLKNALMEHLERKNYLPTLVNRRISRTQAHFNFIPKFTFSEEREAPYTRLFLIASDRPGLLTRITCVFLNEQIHLHHAKIATAGERVEDAFFISNAEHLPLSFDESTHLEKKLMTAIRDFS
jgi:[protein-PII] uridylyltransferase